MLARDMAFWVVGGYFSSFVTDHRFDAGHRSDACDFLKFSGNDGLGGNSKWANQILSVILG